MECFALEVKFRVEEGRDPLKLVEELHMAISNVASDGLELSMHSTGIER